MRLDELAEAVGGRLVDGAAPDAVVAGDVVVDSRVVRPGALFACVVGEQLDGHDFARAAVDSGAVAVLAARSVGVPGVVVEDTTAALADLARAVLGRSSARVVGVTGSSGKTSTKDLLAAVFGAAGETVAPRNSFNNEIGLPLTVLRVTDATQTLVLEYSARGVGHIRYLCSIAQPSISLVLNVGHAHLGEFGSREAIAKAKGELVEALPPDGVAVLNADDDLVSAMTSRTDARAVTFGTTTDAFVRVSDVETDALARPSFTVHTPSGSRPVRLQLPGAHQAMNAAATLTAAFVAGIGLDVAVAALEQTSSISPHRMQLRERADGAIVIDDAYNANPDSVRAALRALAGVAEARGRSWAVLGAMRELGPESTSMHEDVGRYAAELGIARVVGVGADAAAIAAGARAHSGWSGGAEVVDDAETAVELLLAQVRPGDVVLVKASNSEQLWRVADALMAADAAIAVADGGAGA